MKPSELPATWCYFYALLSLVVWDFLFSYHACYQTITSGFGNRGVRSQSFYSFAFFSNSFVFIRVTVPEFIVLHRTKACKEDSIQGFTLCAT